MRILIRAENKRWLGLSGMFAASLLFGLMAFFVRVISADVPNFVIVFIRSIGGVLIFLVLYAFKRIPFQPVNKKLLFLRGFLGAIALALWFHSIGAMSLSKAVFYFYSYPLYTAICSRIFYKEKIYFMHIIGMFFVFAGLMFLSQFWQFVFSFTDVFAILSGAFAGFAMSTIREVRKTDDPWTVVMVFLIMTSVMSFPFAVFEFSFFSAKVWLFLTAIACVATLGQVVITYSFKYCSAVQGSVVSSSSIVFPSALGYFILGEKGNVSTLLGGGMILAGGLFVSLACSKNKDC